MAKHFLIAGRWRVEPDLNRLVGPDGEVRLEARVMRALEFLARHAGQTVQRDQLLDAVWGARHVNEESLTSVVSRLRRALGDDPRRPRIILTVPKRGYRLIGSVDWQPLPSDSESSPAGLRVGWAFAVALIVSLGVVLSFRWSGRPSRPANAAALEPLPLTSAPGVEFDPAFSPNGERLAFVWGGPDDSDLDIWIRALDASTPRRLTSRIGFDGSPSWRPDGGAVAFMHSNNGECGVFLVEIDSADERRIAGCRSHSESSVDWSPRGDVIAFADSPALGEPFRIFLVGTSGGGLAELLTSPPEATFGDLDPAFSPDGSQIAFVRGVNPSLVPPYVSPVHGDIFVVALEGGEPRRLTFDNEEIPGLDWSLDGHRIVFASTRESGRYALWEVDIAGGPPSRILALDGILRNPTPYPEGLAFERVRGVFDLWSLELDDPSAKPVPLLRSTRSESAPAFSPDGRRLAFVSDRSGQPEIWVAAADGSHPVQMTRLELPSTHRPSWSPDGRWVAFEARLDGRTSLWRVEASGGAPERLVGAPESETWHAVVPRFSTEGSRLYFGSDRSGSWQVWSLDLADASLEQVTREGGFAAVEEAAGGDLYYVRLDRPGIWQRSEATGNEVPVDTVLKSSDWASWAADGPAFIRLRRTGWTSGVLERFLEGAAEASSLVELESDHNLILGGVALSPDGSTLVWSQRSRLDFDILTAPGFR